MGDSVFVGRELELHQLETFLSQSLTGKSQLCFVTGDAGAGKSALLEEFARRATEADERLLVVQGECNAQTGLCDPFLPFREILSQLSGDTDNTVGSGKMSLQNAQRLSSFARVTSRALIEVAPDIIGTLIPGGLIVAKAAKIGAEKAGWLTRLEKNTSAAPDQLANGMLFQQISRLLEALAKERPLVLILDDLQWADNASIALLFHLSRALKEAAILILGAYRSDEVALGRNGERHPLAATLNEIRRYRGNVWIELNGTDEQHREAFIDALVDSEPNHLSVDFRSALFTRTDGYPLFTVELLRSLKERGDLVWNETTKCWEQAGDIAWDDLPPRVEGVIDERIRRLSDDLRDILATASVEGIQFTTQVVAHICSFSERALLKALSEDLDLRHHLVQEAGEEKIGSIYLWHYRFTHVVFQEYLYAELSHGQRRLLHRDVATYLEEVYGDRADVIALQLAHHFELAGEDEKAAHYYWRAGEQSAAIYGNVEAIRHFRRSLELGNHTNDDAAAMHEELGDSLYITGDYDSAYEAFEQALQLAPQPSLVTRARLYRKMAANLSAQSQMEAALTILSEARQVLTLANYDEDATWWEWIAIESEVVSAHFFLGQLQPTGERMDALRAAIEQHGTPIQRFDFFVSSNMIELLRTRFVVTEQAMEYAKLGLATANESGNLLQIAVGHFRLGLTNFCVENWAIAEDELRAGHVIADRIGSVLTQTMCAIFLALTFRRRSQVKLVEQWANLALQIAVSAGIDLYIAAAKANLGWVAWRKGEREQAVSLAHEALEIWQQVSPNYPVRWQAQWILLGQALQSDRAEDAVSLARDILRPPQQKMPAIVEEQLAAALRKWDEGATTQVQRVSSRSSD